MIAVKDIETTIGADAIDPEGERIGEVEAVYLDDVTGLPEFALVSTGLFGRRSSFVPLIGAELTAEGELRVVHRKSEVEGAPTLEVDHHLEPSQEAELFAYYDGSSSPTPGTGPSDATPTRRLRPHGR